MKFRLGSIIALSAALFAGSAHASNNYGLPEEIKDGNILHCFDWKLGDVTKELPNIAAAGFVAVQVSPVQAVSPTGYNWSNLYRPYDFTYSRQLGLGTEANLRSLCEEAEKYGIHVIVDVVFNHVDNAGNHDPWWNQNGRLRSTTSGVNYSNRYSITHDRIGEYPEVNSEDPEVTARAKAFIEKLKELGVKGIRFDAAKHIALPSEGCDFWKEVTSVPDMFYYGEILDGPGGSNANTLMKEYTDYMYVTDDTYSTRVRSNAGVPSTEGNWNTKGIDGSKLIYWGESHDTFANTPSYGGVTKNTSQELIDRCYAFVGSRAEGIALYFSRPNYKDYSDIKVGQKGSTHFVDPQVAEVNKFKNAMVGRAESIAREGSAGSITRQGGGAVIVNRTGAGSVSVPNGGSYCPAGEYVDRVSGNTFTVTPETISGTLGASGIAVIYASESGIDDIADDEFDINSRVWYTLQGVKVDNPSQPGIYIMVDGKGRSKKQVIRQ